MRKVLSILALLMALGLTAQSGRPEAYSEIDGISIRVKTCKAQPNGDVVVTFVLKNQHSDYERNELRSELSEVYDDEGNSYSGNAKVQFALANGQFQYHYLPFSMPNGVPVKCKMKISKVDSAASELVLVKICSNSGINHGYHILKNIPITRDGD